MIQPLGDQAGHLAPRGLLHRIDPGGIRDGLVLRGPIVRIRTGRGVEADEGRGPHVLDPLLVIFHGDVERLGHLRIGGRATFGLLDENHRRLNLAGLVVDRAGHPVHLPQLVKDGAADAQPGVGLEAGAVALIEVAHGVEQADEAGAVKIFNVHVRRERHGQPANDRLDEGQVLLDELLFDSAAGAGFGVALPECFPGGNGGGFGRGATNASGAFEGERFGSGFHGSG